MKKRTEKKKRKEISIEKKEKSCYRMFRALINHQKWWKQNENESR